MEDNFDTLDKFVAYSFFIIKYTGYLTGLVGLFYLIFNGDFNIIFEIGIKPFIIYYLMTFILVPLGVFLMGLIGVFSKNKILSTLFFILYNTSFIIGYIVLYYFILFSINTADIFHYFFAFGIGIVPLYLLTVTDDNYLFIGGIYVKFLLSILLLFDLVFLYLGKNFIPYSILLMVCTIVIYTIIVYPQLKSITSNNYEK